MMLQSLRLRLMLGFLLLSLLCWGAAAIGAWWQTRHNINQLFDTQQMLFAKRLTTLNPEQGDQQTLTLPKTKKMLRHNRGNQDDDALAFAIFRRDGQMLMNDGDNGRDFIFDYQRDGFVDGRLRGDDDRWRMVWLRTPDDRYVVVVGQEWEYRDDMTRDLVKTNLMPWLVALPVMLLLMLWLVTRELAPLKQIARQLRQRAPDDLTPLTARRVPQEVRPLLTELNLLFHRIGEMLIRERRFTSDAAHELRSPLAALKVQTEVAQLAHDDAAVRHHALTSLDAGIDRATRLVDQLLTLSRLDAGEDLETQSVQWQQIAQNAVVEHYAAAQAAKVELALDASDTPIIRQGHPLLLALLVRNLLDNAIRYSPPGTRVWLKLTSDALQVLDSGPGVSPEALARIGERFYRPPGQQQSGSGLGLSIVHHIARLHGMTVTMNNRQEGGLAVTVNLRG
ncbi:quorum sensing histidine kinase QseC [Erwinia sorbitola]|uniref:Sensor protein QseC n=1 Tax=Erwinia sorbitola TaxID=2681984 RepID=A0A6I6EMX4_9GAMM|nr:quorum sensing histidine kinase QseC [Erwinia sorbitola]QGU89545.1 two-component system sensor histidine kinase QseC [Erwinia sorbitola]